MKLSTKFTMILAALFTSMLAQAELSYNPDHDETLKNLHAIETASVSTQYQCKDYSLLISAFATQSGINGRQASVNGKIVSKNSAHDISDDLTKAISRHNILTGKMSVSCNADKGAFQIKFTPNEFDKQRYSKTTVNIFANGTVQGSRTTRKKPSVSHYPIK